MTTAQMDWSAIFDRAATAAAFRDTARSSQAARAETADARQRFSLDDVYASPSPSTRPAADAPRSRPEAREARVRDGRSDARVERPAESKTAERPSSEEKGSSADRTSRVETPASDKRPLSSSSHSSREAPPPKPEPSAPDAAAVKPAEPPQQPDRREAAAAPPLDEGAATPSEEKAEAAPDEAIVAEAIPVDTAASIPFPPMNPAPPPEAPSLMLAAAAKPPEQVAEEAETEPADEADPKGPAAAVLHARAELWQAGIAGTGHRTGVAGTDFSPPAANAAAPVAGPVPGERAVAASVESTASTASSPSTEAAPSTPKAVEFAQLLGASAGGEAGFAAPATAPASAAAGPTPSAAAPDAIGALPSAGSVGTATGAAASSAAAAPTASAPTNPAGPPVPLGAVPMSIALRALQETHRFEIRLDPVELGRIDVRLDIDRQDGTVRTDLVVDRPATLALLQRDAGALQQALSQAGLDASGGINLSLRDGSGDGTASGQGQGQNTGGEAARGRPGTPTGTQRADAVGPAAPVAARTLRLSGIDIRI